MDTTPLCPSCGKPLDPKAPKGLCPACLMAGAFPTGTEPEGKSPRFTAPSIEELAPKFPQLDILEFIGQGGMGAVYKARQKELDRIVALKILPPGIGQDASFAERFSREAKVLAKLNHPGIVTIHEFGRADGLYFFVMEFVDGVNLRQLLNTSRISAREALAIVPQICDALQYAHDQGLVHRDIKPENILLDRRGRVKVADFGLAKIVGAERGSVSRSSDDNSREIGSGQAHLAGNVAAGHSPAVQDLTDANKILGTPQYMAPEQKEHPTEVDHRADIYALGVVFYQMLTGELPGKRIEPPSKKVAIDVRLDEIVLRALEKKPELRYQQASVLKTEVETIAETPGSSGLKSAPSEPGISQSRLTSAATGQPSSAEALLREKIFIGFGMAIITTGFFVCLFFAARYPHQALAPLLVMAMAVLGLVVCGLRIAGYWPFPSLLFPRPNFSSRNMQNTGTTPTTSAPTFDLKDARWKTMTWGFVLMLGAIEMATHMDPVPIGWAIGIWGVLLWIISTVLALLAGDDWKTLRIACGIAVIDGLGVASTALWLARTNPLLPIPWRDSITIGCAVGIAYCVRKLFKLATLRTDASSSGAPSAGRRGLKPKHIYAMAGIVLLLLTRTFVLQPFIVRGGGVEPELPVGSHILVWKLGNQITPGDIMAYHHEKQIWVARVVGTTNSGVTANRNGNPNELIPQSQIVGKVVSVYWRAASHGQDQNHLQNITIPASDQNKPLLHVSLWSIRTRTNIDIEQIAGRAALLQLDHEISSMSIAQIDVHENSEAMISIVGKDDSTNLMFVKAELHGSEVKFWLAGENEKRSGTSLDEGLPGWAKLGYFHVLDKRDFEGGSRQSFVILFEPQSQTSLLEPSYNGTKLGLWLAAIDYGKPPESRRQAYEAIQKMGTNVLPFLLADLGDNGIQAVHEGSDLPNDHSREASWAFDALGSLGRPAIPRLVQLLKTNPGYVPSALAGIGRDALPELKAALTNEDFWVRDNTAAAIANGIYQQKFEGHEIADILPVVRNNLLYTNLTNSLYEGNTRHRAQDLLTAIMSDPVMKQSP